MPSRFVNQPDGKLAVFSSVCDDFTHYDLSDAEALEYGIEEWGRQTAEEKIRSARVDATRYGKPDGDGLTRWREALTDMALNHSLDTIRETLAEIGFPDAEIPESALRRIAEIEADRAANAA